MPIGIFSFRARHGFWLDKRTKRDLDTPEFRQERLIAKNLPRAFQSDRANRPVCFHSRLKRAELEWTNSRRRRKRTLGKYDHRLAPLQDFGDVIRLADARLRIAAIEREVPDPPDERANQRHGA